MNGLANEKSVSGRVKHIGLKGLGPNSGELTLVIQSDNGTLFPVYAAIMPQRDDTNSNQDGVFAGFVSVALAAQATRTQLKCDYVIRDKERIVNLELLSD